jgi:hypothetical protein
MISSESALGQFVFCELKKSGWQFANAVNQYGASYQ